MNKVSVFLFVFFLITNCSLDNKTGFWTQDEKTELKKIEIREGDLKELFVEEGAYIKEFNPGLKIAIKFKPKNNYTNTTDNNDSFINYD